jgi:hypothetical protein
MADSTETRILKDINRHLAHMDDGGGEKGLSDHLSPSETAALNKNVQEIMGNFSSMVNTQLKNSIKATGDSIKSAFGQMQDHSDDQVSAIDDVVDELKMNNRFAAKDEHNEFLKESEREADLNINKRTNTLLEDLVDKEDDSAALAKADSKSSRSFFGGGMGGLFGGLMAGKGIKGLLGGVKGLAKGIFFPALVGLAGFHFMKGWKEAGEDASVIDKFKSGIGKMASTLTFGLISKEFLVGAMDKIEVAIGKAWDSFSEIWNDSTNGLAGKIDETLSNLTMGMLSPEDIESLRGKTNTLLEKFNASIQGLLTNTLGFDLNLAVQDFYAGIDEFIDNTIMLFQDPVGLIIKKLRSVRDRLAQEEQVKSEAAAKGDISEVSAIDMVKKLATWDLTDAEMENLKTQEIDKFKNSMDAIGGFFSKVFDWGKESAGRISDENARAERIKSGNVNLAAMRKGVSAVGQEGIKQRIANEEALRDFKKQQSAGDMMQINQSNTVATPLDRQTENDDALGLQRSSGASGS